MRIGSKDRLSEIENLFLSNRALNQSAADQPPRKRLLYFALRLGVALLIGVVVWLVGLHRHPGLK